LFFNVIKTRSFSTVVIIVFFLIFGAAAFISYQMYRNALRHTINENKATARILSNLIYEHQKAAIGILESYANRSSFVDAVEKKAFDQMLPLLKFLSEYHAEIDALFVADRYGTLWANYPVDRKVYGRNLAHRDWYKGVSKKWKPYISTVYSRVVVEKGLATAIAVPVFDRKNNVIGILSTAQRTDFLSNLIESNKLNPDKNVTLADQEGNVIYSDVAEHKKEIIKCTHFSLISKAIKENKNTIEAIDHLKNNKEEILAFSPVKDIGWTIIIGEGKRTILKSHITDFVIIFSIAFLLFVCITIAALLLQRNLKYKKAKELLEKERQLRESEDKFRVLAESTPTAVMMYQNDKWLYANRAAEAISGYTLNELTKMEFWAFVHPDYRSVIQERGRKRQKGDNTINRYEFKIISKDGSEKWVDLSGASTVFNGSPAGIISVTDITDRKQAQEKIKRIADEWITTFDSINDLISIQDRDFKIVRVNKAYAKAFKTSPDELIGKYCYEVLHGTDCPMPNCPYEKTQDARTSKSEEIFESNLGKYIEISTSPVFDARGEVAGSVHIVKDISERKRAEDLIKVSEERHRNISALTSDYIYSCVRSKDSVFAVDWISGAFEKITGYTNDELMQRGCWLTLVHPEDFERVSRFLIDLKPGESGECEFRIITRDGKILWIYDYNKCMEHESLPDHYRLLGASQNITERKNMEESLRETLEKLRKSLAGTIQAMSLTVETRDPYTAGHQRRVSNLARTIAQEMGLSADTVDNIRMAGIIHDIGKISVPAELLAKPTKLTDIEMGLIKVHSQSGYDILKDVELPYPIAEMVLQHHERLDGSGYPQGLKGNQILLETKILSVADVIEAIATHRPYRPARGIEPALEEIEKNKGILYDEKVVDICLKLFREKGFSFE